MKQSIKQLLCYAAMAALLAVFSPISNIYAQPVNPASSGSAINYPLRVCNATTCPTGTSVEMEVWNTPLTMNADMATIKRDVTATPVHYNLPSELGISINYAQLFGITYSGISNTDLMNHSGFTINTDVQHITNSGTTAVPQTLPYWGLGLTTTANDPDIAIGSHTIAPGGYNHFALVTYEMDGYIFLERHGISVDQNGIVSMFPAPPGGIFGCTVFQTVPPSILCAVSPSPFIFEMVGHQHSTNPSTGFPSIGFNSKPRIEIWHKAYAAFAGTQTTAEYFTVTWQKEVSPGVFEVWAMDGYTDGSVLNNEYKVADGKMPDVVAVSASAGPGGSGDYRSYITYLDNNDEVLYVDECRYGNNTTFAPTRTLATLAMGDKFSTPRISGPMYYDYTSPSNLDPLCVVAVNDNTGSIDNVSAYKLYHSSITSPGPQIPKPDITGDGSNGFSDNSKIAIMPSITGVGQVASGMAGVPAYTDYAVGFYSEYTPSTSGDLFAFGVDMDVNNTAPYLPGGSYQQINFLGLDYSSGTAYSLGTPPAFAMSTANNSGYDMVSAYFLGGTTSAEQLINVAFNGAAAPPYAFKPGRPSGVQVATKAEYATYPNPVTNVLNITQANGAEYMVTNALGQLLNFGTLQGDKAQVSTGSLAAGMYILTISKDGHTEKVKFVKQ